MPLYLYVHAYYLRPAKQHDLSFAGREFQLALDAGLEVQHDMGMKAFFAAIKTKIKCRIDTAAQLYFDFNQPLDRILELKNWEAGDKFLSLLKAEQARLAGRNTTSKKRSSFLDEMETASKALRKSGGR